MANSQHLNVRASISLHGNFITKIFAILRLNRIKNINVFVCYLCKTYFFLLKYTRQQLEILAVLLLLPSSKLSNDCFVYFLSEPETGSSLYLKFSKYDF